MTEGRPREDTGRGWPSKSQGETLQKNNPVNSLILTSSLQNYKKINLHCWSRPWSAVPCRGSSSKLTQGPSISEFLSIGRRENSEACRPGVTDGLLQMAVSSEAGVTRFLRLHSSVSLMRKKGKRQQRNCMGKLHLAAPHPHPWACILRHVRNTQRKTYNQGKICDKCKLVRNLRKTGGIEASKNKTWLPRWSSG